MSSDFYASIAEQNVTIKQLIIEQEWGKWGSDRARYMNL